MATRLWVVGGRRTPRPELRTRPAPAVGAQPSSVVRHGMASDLRLARAQRPLRCAQSLVFRDRALCRGLVLADDQHARLWLHADAPCNPRAARTQCVSGLIR